MPIASRSRYIKVYTCSLITQETLWFENGFDMIQKNFIKYLCFQQVFQFQLNVATKYLTEKYSEPFQTTKIERFLRKQLTTLFLRDHECSRLGKIRKKQKDPSRSLCEKCQYSEFFWYVFPCIWTEYEEIQNISVRMRENTDQKNSECRHLSSSGCVNYTPNLTI